MICLIDAILFLFFSLIVIAVPIIDAQTIFPLHLFPDPLIDLKNWYIREYDDYLLADKPNFFVGFVWLEIFYQWPLAVASLYGIAASKSWFPTTSLIYGVSALTSMVFFFPIIFTYLTLPWERLIKNWHIYLTIYSRFHQMNVNMIYRSLNYSFGYNSFMSNIYVY